MKSTIIQKLFNKGKQSILKDNIIYIIFDEREYLNEAIHILNTSRFNISIEGEPNEVAHVIFEFDDGAAGFPLNPYQIENWFNKLDKNGKVLILAGFKNSNNEYDIFLNWPPINIPVTVFKPMFTQLSTEDDSVKGIIGIYASKGATTIFSGTGVIIAPNLAITATHVITEFLNKFDKMDDPLKQLVVDPTFEVFAVQNYKASGEGIVWKVEHFVLHREVDIALLFLTPVNKGGSQYTWDDVASINLEPPNINDKVIAYGFVREKEFKKIDEKLTVIKFLSDESLNSRAVAQAIGTVKEVHQLKRDNSLLPFPCFMTEANFAGGMSGGPVFNSAGFLIGIVCSSMSQFLPEDPSTSYATLIWPFLTMKITIQINDDTPKLMSIFSLVKAGIIRASGVEKFYENEDGSIGFILKPGEGEPQIYKAGRDPDYYNHN